jgi:hypothetical protein
MTSLAKPQLTLDFEPSLGEQFKTLKDYVSFRVQEQRLNAATLAAKMDLSPSVLSRKLNGSKEDTQRFNTDDLEGYIVATGDVSSVMEYLAAKYMDSDVSKKQRVLAKVEGMLPELVALIASMKEAA